MSGEPAGRATAKDLSAPRVAVVGHVEWVTFMRVPNVPSAGEIIHIRQSWSEPGGSGAVAAVQLAKLAGGCLLFTALPVAGTGRASTTRLAQEGVTVRTAPRPRTQRRAYVYVDAHGERTITTVGDRLLPDDQDDLPWDELSGLDAVYFASGTAGSLRQARRARVLVANSRTSDAINDAGVDVDAIVLSGRDQRELEAARALKCPPALIVTSMGPEGGHWAAADGRTGTWPATVVPGSAKSAYGAGDSFMAGLTFALATGLDAHDAVHLAARCGAAKLTAFGSFGGQIGRDDL